MGQLQKQCVLFAVFLACNLAMIAIVAFGMNQISRVDDDLLFAAAQYFVLGLGFFPVTPFGSLGNFAILLVLVCFTLYFLYRFLHDTRSRITLVALVASNVGIYALPILFSSIGGYHGP